MPKIKCHVHFHTHGFKEDAELLLEPFSKSDLYIPEIANASRKFQRKIYSLAAGKISFSDFMRKYIRPEENREDRYLYNFYTMLSGCQKPIFIMEKPLFTNEPGSRLLQIGKLARKLYAEGETREACETYRHFVVQLAENGSVRNEYLVRNFAKRIRDKIRRSPDLLGRSDVRVLLSIGAAHYPIFELIEAQLPGRCTKSVYDSVGSNSKLALLLHKLVYEDRQYIPTDKDIIEIFESRGQNLSGQ